MTLNLLAARNWSGVVNLQAQPAPGSWSEVMKVKSEGQGGNSTTCKSPTIDTLEQVFKDLREKLNLADEAPVLDLKTNVLISGWFVSTPMKAAVHLGTNYTEILEVYGNANLEELQNLFDITQRWMLNHEAEILNSSPIDWTAPSRTKSALPHGQVITWTKERVQVFSDSVLCKTTPHKTIFAVQISTRNSRASQKVNKSGTVTTSEFGTQNDKHNNMCNDLKHVETHEHIQWLVNAMDWTTAELVCFLWSLFLAVSVSVPWLFSLSRCTHTAWLKGWQELRFTFVPHCTRMCHLVVSAVLDLFHFSVHFISFLLISLITLPFLLPDTFNFHDVVDKYSAYFRWGPWHPGRERASYKLWVQRPHHHGDFCRRHPGVLKRVPVPWWHRLRWRHRRQDAPWYVPKTSRGLSSCLSSSVSHGRTERPVVCSLVSSAQETQRHNSENEQIWTLLERQREQILADYQAEIQKHEFQAD